MTIAYIISAYKHPALLGRLVGRLRAPGTSFLIHIDRKADDATHRRLVAAVRGVPNVHLLRRHVCEWGGFGHVAATLEGIRTIVRMGIDCDYVVLLTGQDYPLKANSQIAAWFQEHAGREFLDHFPLPHSGWDHGGLNRIDRWHWRFRGRHVEIEPAPWLPIRRSIPGGRRPYGGSSYWCLTRDCIRYIDAWTGSHPSFVRFFRTVDVPDELFFQTIVLDSPFAGAVVNDDLRHIEWADPDAGSPVVLTRDHLDRLLASPKLYARKFDPAIDSAVLDELDRAAASADAPHGR